MEIEKRKNKKCSNINPSCIKEMNKNSVNIFDTTISNKNNNSYKDIFKLKRNFK